MSQKKSTFIIVDDDSTFTVVLKKHLQAFPELSLISTYHDSVSALLGIKKFRPDILFLDWNIDTFKGSDIIETLESVPLIIILSSDPEVKYDNLPGEVFAFLQKPISDELKFMRTIRQAISINLVNRQMDNIMNQSIQ